MHAHSHDDEHPDDAWNLYQHIERVEGMNIRGDAEAARGIFKPHTNRTDAEPVVVSDTDEEFMIKIWFVSPVSVNRIIVALCGHDRNSHPSSVRFFTGIAAETLGLDDMEEVDPAQTMDLDINEEAEKFQLCRPKCFTHINFLLLHFPGNHGGLDHTSVSYIGLQGPHSHAKREAVEAKYELVPNPGHEHGHGHAHGHGHSHGGIHEVR
eukprot:Skav236483  [mRNA]  locus=scaffold1440:204201:204827:+ [translate_table: standard]